MGADPGFGFLGGYPVSGFLILIMLLLLILGSWSRSMRIRERKFPMNLGWTNRGYRGGLLTADYADGADTDADPTSFSPWERVVRLVRRSLGEGGRTGRGEGPPARSALHFHRAGAPDQAALQERNDLGLIVRRAPTQTSACTLVGQPYPALHAVAE
jgi:hypothetical protein